MIHRIFNLMEMEGINAAELARETGISNKVFSAWKRGLQKPSVDAIIKISTYFKVSTDYLLKGEDTKMNNTIQANNGNIGVVGQANAPITIHNGNGKRELTDEETELLRIYTHLNVKNKHKLLSIAFELEEGL